MVSFSETPKGSSKVNGVRVKILGCNSVQCPSGKVCVEHTIPCIGKSCKKSAKCANPGSKPFVLSFQKF